MRASQRIATTGCIAACLSTLLLAGGCGRSKWPALVPFEGRVTLDGEPLPGKVVTLIAEKAAEAGALTSFSQAITAEDGAYAVLSSRPGGLKAERGVAPGRYVVTVTEPADGSKIPQEQQRSRKSVIPPPYTEAPKTKLRVEVPPKGGRADLELASRP